MNPLFIAVERRIFCNELTERLLNQPCRTIFLKNKVNLTHQLSPARSERNGQLIIEWALANGFQVIVEQPPEIVMWDITFQRVINPERARRIRETGVIPRPKAKDPKPFKRRRRVEKISTCNEFNNPSTGSNSDTTE